LLLVSINIVIIINCSFFCLCSHYSDEEEYYTILADMQDEEDDVYGDLIAIKDRPRIAFPFMPVNHTHL